MRKPIVALIEASNSTTEDYFQLGSQAPFRRKFESDFDLTVFKGPCSLRSIEKFYQEQQLNLDLILIDTSNMSKDIDPEFDILDLDACPDVPRVGFTLADAHARVKPHLFQLFHKVGTEAIFCVDTGMPSMIGDFEGKVILIPWFYDSELYRNYDEEKIIPIALLGNGFKIDETDLRYPWRQEVTRALLGKAPFITFPRPDKDTPHDLRGESYARMLNRSQFACTCGSVRQHFVKKYIEIPASHTCLMTEDIPILQSMGFKHEENCLFVNGATILDVYKKYGNDPTALETITRKGAELIQQYHLAEHRTQLSEWIELRKNLKAGESIDQTGIRAPLIKSTDSRPAPFLADNSKYKKIIEKGISLIKKGNYQEAKTTFNQLTSLVSFSTETKYYLLLSSLLSRDNQQTKKLCNYYARALENNPVFVDPSVLALVALALVSQGKTRKAQQLLNKHHGIDNHFLWSTKQILKVDDSQTEHRGDNGASVFEHPGKDKKQVELIISAATNRNANSWLRKLFAN